MDEQKQPAAENPEEVETIDLGNLREEERDIVNQRFIDEKTYAQISKALGISEDAARQKVSRAIDKLRKFLSRGRNESK